MMYIQVAGDTHSRAWIPQFMKNRGLLGRGRPRNWKQPMESINQTLYTRTCAWWRHFIISNRMHFTLRKVKLSRARAILHKRRHISLFTCMVSLFTSQISLFTCIISLFTCKISLFTCIVSLFTCQISIFTCMISLFTCQISQFSRARLVFSRARSVFSGARSVFSRARSVFSRARSVFSQQQNCYAWAWVGWVHVRGTWLFLRQLKKQWLTSMAYWFLFS